MGAVADAAHPRVALALQLPRLPGVLAANHALVVAPPEHGVRGRHQVRAAERYGAEAEIELDCLP